MDRITMRQWRPLLLLLCFVISSSSLLVSSQTSSDSCTAALSLGDLIPFNTTGLSCFQAWTSQDFILRFGKDASGGSSNDTWSFVLSAPDSGGYIAVGFSPTARKMVGSSAVAGWVTSSSGAGTARQYYLGGTSSSSCPPDKGKLSLTSGPASPTIVSKGSRLYLAFQLSGQPLTDLVYAVGPAGKLPASNGLLPRHQDMASGTISLSGGNDGAGSTSTGGGDDEGGSEGKGNKHKHSGGDDGGEDGDGDEGKGERRNSPSSSASSSTASGGGGLNAKRRHGVLAAISWGFTIPIGVAAARFLKRHDPLWFYLHAAVQGLGFVVGAVAVVAGFRLDDGEDGDVGAHKAVGVAVLVCGCLQVMAVLARPVKESKARRYWNWYHHYVGRAAVVLGAGNVLYGLSLAKEGQEWSYVYGVFVGVCAVAYLVLEEWRRRH